MYSYFIALLILASYFFVVFVVLRAIVPFMGFSKAKLPLEVPEDMQKKINELKTTSFNKKQYLEAVYNFITHTWHAGRMDTVWYAPLAFRSDLKSIWGHAGYAHCNTQNYIMYIMLVRSGFFREDDITFHHVFFNFFIHQYLRVKVGDVIVPVDPAGAGIRGLPLGTYISWFG